MSSRGFTRLVALLATGCGPGAAATAGSSSGSEGSASVESSSSSDAGETEATPTTGAPVACGCDDPQIVEGDLDVAGLAAFAGGCVGEVGGRLEISGVVDPSLLQPLLGLRKVNTLQIHDNPGLVDLAPLACLEQITDRFSVWQNPGLLDLDALGRVRVAQFIEFFALPITAMPSFAPDYQGARTLYLEGLPGLVDLDPLAAWPSVVAETGAFAVDLSAAPALQSIAGLAGPLGPADLPGVERYVALHDLPALTSLTGLEALRAGDVTLSHLPQVHSLAPLSGLTHVNTLRLLGLPGLTTLHGLHALQTATELQIGGCGAADGLAGLVDLTGLDALVEVETLGSILGNSGLLALTGAPKLQSIGAEFGGLDLVDNAKLGAAAVAALDAQADISHLCFGDSLQCGCLRRIPESVQEGCPAAWSGGSAVTAEGEGGALDGTTAFFGWTGPGGPYNPTLNLVVADAAADLEAVRDDGLTDQSGPGAPKLVLETSLEYQDWIGTPTSSGAQLVQSRSQQSFLTLQVTVSERLGDWTGLDPADPPRLVGEILTVDADATTTVQGPFDAVYCRDFSRVLTD